MSFSRVRCCVLLCAAFAMPASIASAQTPAASGPNVPPRAAPGSLGHISAERRALLARMMADPSNLDIAFEYASLSADAGDLEGAISTLERMLIFAPGLPRLDLELGVLYYRLGAYDSANSYFQAALAGPEPVPPQVRTKVAAYLAAIGKQTQPNKFEGAITLGTQYQTNANGGPSSLNIDLNDLPFLLNQSAASTPDADAFAAGTFRWSTDLADQGDRFVTGLQTYGALYRTQSQLNTGAAELTFGPDLNLQRFHIDDARLGIYGILGGVALGGDPYLLSGGVGANIEKGLGPNTRVGLQGEFREQSFQNSSLQPLASDRSGTSIRGLASVQYQVTDVFSIFGDITTERRNAQTGYLSLLQLGATAGGTLAFRSPLPQQTDPWSFTLSVSYLQRDHDAPDPLINAAHAEVEHEADVQGTLSIPLQQGWSMDTTASYRQVMSNYDIDNISDISGSVGFTKKF